MRRIICILLACLVTSPAGATEALSGDTIRLDDGRTVRLLGIKAADEDNAAKQALQDLVSSCPAPALDHAALDRYGRIAADAVCIKDAHQLWLQGELLRQGYAFVYPPSGDEPRLADLMKAEQAARLGHKGIWNDKAFKDLASGQPDTIPYGVFAFVRGTVVKAERVKNMVYLNFGEDWHHDFTVAIAAHDLRVFKKAGMDPLGLRGKTIRVRGWVKRDFGPRMAITDPAQIEPLGEPPS